MEMVTRGARKKLSSNTSSAQNDSYGCHDGKHVWIASSYRMTGRVFLTNHKPQ